MTLKKAAYKEDLDLAHCEEHDCSIIACEDPLFIHSNCHRGLPYFASYFDGVLTLTCPACDKVIIQIAVASRKDEE